MADIWADMEHMRDELAWKTEAYGEGESVAVIICAGQLRRLLAHVEAADAAGRAVVETHAPDKWGGCEYCLDTGCEPGTCDFCALRASLLPEAT